MGFVVLQPQTVVNPHANALPDRGLVGSGAIWADGSDSTYFATSATRAGSLSPALYDANATMDALVMPAGSTVTDVHLNLRAANLATSTCPATATIAFQNPTTGTGFAVPGVGPTYPSPTHGGALLNGVLVTATTPTDHFTLIDATDAAVVGLTMDDLVAALVAGANVNVYVGANEATANGQTTRLRVYELNLEVTYTEPAVTVAPPLRLTNRSDVFASAPSLTRSGVSRQGGNRITGYL